MGVRLVKRGRAGRINMATTATAKIRMRQTRTFLKMFPNDMVKNDYIAWYCVR